MKFYNVIEGEWQQPVLRGYLMKCCDCGLVHRMNFKIIDSKTKKKVKGYNVLIQAFRYNKKK